MSGGFQNSHRARMRDSLPSPDVELLVVLAALPPLAVSIGGFIEAMANREWVAVSVTAIFALFLVGLIWKLTRRHKPRTLGKTSTFNPFQRLNPKDVWPRSKDSNRIVEAIADKQEQTPLVVGSSGVGKTILLDVIVRADIKARGLDWDYHVVGDDYASLNGKLKGLIPKGAQRQRLTVIVLDQFEQWLALINSQDDVAVRRRLREWLKDVLNQVRGMPNCTILLSLRREWYYDLRFLGDIVPGLLDVCDVRGPIPDDDDGLGEMRSAMLESFSEVVAGRDESQATEILTCLGGRGRISPLEAQIVGAVLERAKGNGQTVDFKYFDRELGGVSGAVDTFFEEMREGSAHPYVCLKVLCALAFKTRFREQTEIKNILGCLFEDTDVVLDAVKYLHLQGLVVDHGAGNYELAHDFLADFFNNKSGEILHPTERDNIFVYIASGGQHSEALSAATKEHEDRAHKRARRGWIVAGGLLTLMTLRLLRFGVNTTLVGPSVSHPVAGNLLDVSYVVVFVPYAAWIFYISMFYDRILVRLDESRMALWFSEFIIVSLVISTVVGTVIPFAWLLAIALGGMIFATKLLSLARWKALSPTARQRLTPVGAFALLNLVFVVLLGSVGMYVSFNYVWLGHYWDSWILMGLLAASMLTYWCLALVPQHVARPGVSQLLGLIGRPGRVAVAPAE